MAMSVFILIALLTPEFPLSSNPCYLFLALLVSAMIGLISGITPAWKASTLSPIYALRDE
jgi:putative ABC transport system permease protein